MDTLHLTLKEQWFDMILSGVKKEEYREVKPYWVRRLLDDKEAYSNPMPPVKGFYEKPERYKYIEFRNGYGNHVPSLTIEWQSIDIREPNPDWCPKGTTGLWFVLNLGAVVKTNNLN